MIALPRLMVAPTGARRSKDDHPALPVTTGEIVDCAEACHAAGAGALHAHVRDGEGRHTLDAGLYRDLLARMTERLPGMVVQITTEAVGRHTPEEMRDVVEAVPARAVSVALSEMMPERGGAESDAAAEAFHARCLERDIAVQHILYSPAEAERLAGLVAAGRVPGQGLSAIFVLGSYDGAEPSDPAEIAAFRAAFGEHGLVPDWMVCAFGPAETECLAAALAEGGKARVGFENSLWHADGSLAHDNAERVAEIAKLL